ncbi:hypothetical protein RhiJN_12185 [Ceratobasidium sp. AG-Ba]|nr:hypothetical protein RhiJN_12185 [Ceratobasidium sp. AG-Ba]QRW12802.1 hypothetical protein RhiLY_11801 [Ceratobasidium sp. AG-Ba]
MGRLHMKQTPAELEVEEERAWRKAQRAARKGRHPDSDEHSSWSERKHKRKRSRSPSSRRKKRHSPSPFDEGWEPPASSSKIDVDALRAEMEERQFREKLFDAMGDDAGLDGIGAHYNEYVPPRWRDPGDPTAKVAGGDLANIDDEEYAEWVREGMWRRTHRAEVEAQEQAEVQKQKRKEKEKARKEETRRMEREAEERRAKRQQVKQQQHAVDAWIAYDARWNQLRAGRAQPGELAFTDLPWPSYPPPKLPLSPEALSRKAVTSFLLSPLHSIGKPRKQRLREALLLYHPDRFVAKWMGLVQEADALSVQEAVGRVARVLTAHLEEGDQGD